MTLDPVRPYVVLSAAVSLDGYLDDASERRLLLSGDADLDRVDQLRASCDAILVGASTVRRDDPVLQVRSATRRAARASRGEAPSPVRVTVTASGALEPVARIFTVDGAATLVYCPSSLVDTVAARLGAVGSPAAGLPPAASEVHVVGLPVTSGLPAASAHHAPGSVPVRPSEILPRLLADLASRGVRRLVVEGGAAVHAQLLVPGFADELQLAVAPWFVADARAPRFVGHRTDRRLPLVETRPVGDMVLMRYALSDRCPGIADPGP